MLIRYPDYLPMFQCLAGQCPDSCCRGWGIGIDPKSLERYASWEGALGNRLRNSIDWENGCFLEYEGRCAFLNEENLCDLYLEGGKGAFCKTCRTYPRHIEAFENVREISLSLSCPAAMELILSGKGRAAFVEKEWERPLERYRDYDRELYRQLCVLRAALIEAAERKDLSARCRVSWILALGHDAESRLSNGDRKGLLQLISRSQMKSDRFEAYLRRKIHEKPGISPEETSKRYLELFRSLYPARDNSASDWKKSSPISESEGKAARGRAAKDSANPLSPVQEDAFSEALSSLLIYFLFTYLCGSVYDGKIFQKVQLSVYLTAMVFLLAEDRRDGKREEPGADPASETAERSSGISGILERDPNWRRHLKEAAVQLSRQIEHEDRNLELLERAMERGKREEFSLMSCLMWADRFFS